MDSHYWPGQSQDEGAAPEGEEEEKESFWLKEGLKRTGLDGAAERVRHNWISRSLPSSEVV